MLIKTDVILDNHLLWYLSLLGLIWHKSSLISSFTYQLYLNLFLSSMKVGSLVMKNSLPLRKAAEPSRNLTNSPFKFLFIVSLLPIPLPLFKIIKAYITSIIYLF